MNQLIQTIGQFLIVFLTGMAVYKNWNEVAQMGLMNAVWQPMIQAGISALSIWGFSKIPQIPPKIAALLLGVGSVVVLAGCGATIPANPTNMSPDQLKEWIKDKNANVSCGRVNSPYGVGVGVYVVLDKGILIDGTVVVDDQCKVTITNTPKR